MINASGKNGIDRMMKLGQRVVNGKEMLEDWKTSVMLPIYKGKGDVTNCGAYRGVKLLENRMKIIEKVLEKRIRALVRSMICNLALCQEDGQQMLFLY